MNSQKHDETVIYRYIFDHGLKEGDPLPLQDEFALMLMVDASSLDSAIDVARERGVISRDATGGLTVKSLRLIPDQEWLSFSHSAKMHGKAVRTELVEAKLRPPIVSADDPVATDYEQAAHEALGLEKGDPFIVISRIRWLDDPASDDPRIIHRAFLDPKRFPETFLKDHDFERESLVHIYNELGYKILRRKDAMRARGACLAERNTIKTDLNGSVLDLEQRTIASGPDANESFVLEYLRATYWKITFDFER